MHPLLEAFHIDTRAGFRFCVLRRPNSSVIRRGTIVHVHAFAEEMNKSRRMVALAADAWARDGWCVLQIDLGGCGDSAGDFAEASWEGWLQDVRLAHRWARENVQGPVWLWGVRLGALLACEVTSRFKLDCGLLLWQPVCNGKQHLHQFLRLWQAARVVGKVDTAEGESPRKRLVAGETVEIAGYALSPALTVGMEAAQISVPHAPHGVHWFQLSAVGASTPLPALERIESQWSAAKIALTVHAAAGPAFWQTQEIEIAPELLERSRTALMTRGASPS